MNATLATLTRLARDSAPSDGALLDAFLAGDQGAFAALVRRHAGPVFAACRRILRHQQDAEDAFQATFLVLARRAADVWPREAVGSWLFGVAHRVALKARATRAKRHGREHALEDCASAAPPPPDCDLAEAVHRVVGKLPDVYRAAVVACDLQGLSRKDAAAQLGWTEGTLSGRLARARGLLAARLRRLGFALPAGGLVAVYGTAEVASAAFVQGTIDLATGAAVAGASAPVAALTHGVVQSMALFKFKAMAAVVFAACAVGFGAYTASGSGDGQQSQTQTQGGKGGAATPAKPPAKAEKPTDPATKDATKPGPRVELAQQELRVLAEELVAAGKGKLSDEAFKRLGARIAAVERLLDADDRAMTEKKTAAQRAALDELQGKWRIVSITQGDKAQLTDTDEPWVIEVSGSTLKMPYKGATGDWKTREYKIGVDPTKTPKEIDLFAPNEPVARGAYEFVAPAATCATCHQGPLGAAVGKEMTPCGPGVKALLARPSKAVQLRLAIGGSKRPTQFGFDAGTLSFELTRVDAKPADEEAQLKAQYQRIAEMLRAAHGAEDQKRLEADLARTRAALSRQAAEVELIRAQEALRHAQVNAEVAHAQVETATLGLKEAKAKVEAAEKALADLKKSLAPPAKGGEFTVHIRTLTAAEKVVRVKDTGNSTVLDALANADGVTIKPDAVSVWVVRDGAVLPVDLAGITQQGVTKTNYVLKAGDQLFVQAKAAK